MNFDFSNVEEVADWSSSEDDDESLSISKISKDFLSKVPITELTEDLRNEVLKEREILLTDDSVVSLDCSVEHLKTCSDEASSSSDDNDDVIEPLNLSYSGEEVEKITTYIKPKASKPMRSKLELLQQNRFFKLFPSELQHELLKLMTPSSFNDGDIILRQGESGESVGFILDGKCSVWTSILPKISGENPTTRHITYLYPSAHFGEYALLFSSKRRANISSVGSSKILFLSKNAFFKYQKVPCYFLAQKISFLEKLPRENQLEVAQHMKVVKFKENDFIMRKGDIANSFYIIINGEAGILSSPEEGEVTVVATLRAGHTMGQIAICNNKPRNATVIALTDVVCLQLNKKHFEKLTKIKESIAEETKKITRVRSLRRERAAERKKSKTNLINTDLSFISNNDNTAFSKPATPVERESKLKKDIVKGEKRINEWILKELLGKGTFGKVRRCVNARTKFVATIKLVDKRMFNSEQKIKQRFDRSLSDLYREIDIMEGLYHPNVVQLLSVIDDPAANTVYILMEYCAKRGIFDTSNKKVQNIVQPLDEDLARKYFRDVLSGLNYLHALGIVHRDIKPMNLFVTASDVVKIGDFGAACQVTSNGVLIEGEQRISGSPAFMSPELLNPDDGASFSLFETDVWSCGATLFMFVTGKPPWVSSNELDLAHMVKFDELKYPDTWNEMSHSIHLKHLIDSLLQKNVSLRLSLREIINHEWVTLEGSDPLDIAPLKGKRLMRTKVDELNPLKKFKRLNSGQFELRELAIRNNSESFRNPYFRLKVKDDNTANTRDPNNSPHGSSCSRNATVCDTTQDLFETFRAQHYLPKSVGKVHISGDFGVISNGFRFDDGTRLYDFNLSNGKSLSFKKQKSPQTERKSFLYKHKIPFCGVYVEFHRLNYSTKILKGTRQYQEDRIALIEDFVYPNKKNRYLFAGVFDGFGGSTVSDYLCNSLAKSIVGSAYFPENIEKAMKQGIYETNKKFLLKAMQVLEDDRNKNAEDFQYRSLLRTRNKTSIINQYLRAGSTAAMVLIETPVNGIQTLHYSWLGDSRLLLCSQGKGKMLTVDHKCTNVDEATRIRAAGGTINFQNRLNGATLVSRGFGALHLVGNSKEDSLSARCKKLRNYFTEPKINESNFQHGAFSFRPEYHSLKVTADIDFVFIGSDGVFENLSSTQVIEILYQALNLSKHPDVALQALTNKINQADNASMVLILFN